MFVFKKITTTNNLYTLCNVGLTLFCPAISCPAFSGCALLCPTYLVRHFHVLQFHALQIPRKLVRQFHVLQFHALHIGPSISCPAISCLAILMVRHFHVLHFQSTHRCFTLTASSRILFVSSFRRSFCIRRLHTSLFTNNTVT